MTKKMHATDLVLLVPGECTQVFLSMRETALGAVAAKPHLAKAATQLGLVQGWVVVLLLLLRLPGTAASRLLMDAAAVSVNKVPAIKTRKHWFRQSNTHDASKDGKENTVSWKGKHSKFSQ
jgi:hypothetical protein